ncbi:DEAD/DEAH box helicase [Microbacterium sulfonylureivorans]|uniref:DEAD/DEAH box helicase n=1 Tax=Microbacterium sulfonylureivorans TaxID=2486854 RepID=UPI001F0CA984|nr:DEAD/DEAH box helicase [Microbacterium sulfonylureivorans]
MTPPFVDAEHIRRRSDEGGYRRGEAYFRDGAVRTVTWDPRTESIDATVDGSGGATYRCRIHLASSRTEDPILSTTCTCPVHADCKHVVATLLESNRVAREAAPVPATPPAWRALLDPPGDPSSRHPPTALALGVELRQRVRRGASAWAAVRVETATPRGLHRFGADVLLGLRPLERSARTDAWIKGAVTWDALRRPGHGYDPAHARWFAELHSIGRDLRLFGTFSDASEWLTLDDIESSLLWPHLRGGHPLGVPLVPTKRQMTVALADSAELVVRAERGTAGLRLEPRVTIDGSAADAATLRPIGHSGVYRFEVRRERLEITLAPVALPDPVPALLSAREPVTVPHADETEFVRDHLPRLVRRVAVEAVGIDIPPAERPRLVLAVRFSPSHRLEYVFAWRYGRAAPLPYPASGSADRDAAAEDAVRRRVETVWAETAPGAFAAEGALSGLEAAEFAARVLPALEGLDDVEVELIGERPRYRELTGDPHVSISTVESSDPDWFDLGIIVTIDGRTIPFAPLFTALTRGRRKLLLSDGQYFSLAHPSLQRLRDLIEEAGDLAEWETGPRISRYQTDLWADFEDVADEAEPAVSWRATAEGLRGASGIPSLSPPVGLRAQLRPYQREGFEWLAFLWQHRLGGILADDMGLGKTLQMLALIAHTRAAGETRPFLVVAPTSVLSTWREEAARFTPDLRVAVVDATRAKREAAVADAAASVDVVITSYTLLRLDEREFSAVAWAGLVLDEAQFVKNSQTKAHRAARDLTAEVTFAITGTPLENSLTELWSLLSLAAPGLFPSARRFRDEYLGPIEQGKVPENQVGGEYRARRLARLRRRIRPLVLRRTKELVAADLPAKQEQHVRIELSAAHRALYDTVLQRERQKVLGLLDDLDRNRFIVFRSLTLLRMLSLAPELVDPAHAHIAPSKLTALFEQLDEILAEGHRTLVFSQFTSFLGLVSARLEERGIPYAYLDGSTRDRDAAIAAFRGGEAPVFLISLKAGGFGLTLTEADYVFLLDPWWNPAAEAQAVDRAHRIGQTRSVMVYRLIANGTIEEKVMALQERKAKLFRAVMDDDALFGQALTAEDIRGLFDG